MLFDTHAHINFSAYKNDAEEVIGRTLKKGVSFIAVGTQYSTSERAVEYAKKYPGKIFAAIGIHPIHLKAGIMEYRDSEELEPTEIKTQGEIFEAEKYLNLAKIKEVVAIGEVGLDYHHFEIGDDIEKLKNNKKVEIINNNYSNLQSENFKILKLAKEKKAKIITKNFELNKMAIVKGVEVINLNDIYESLKPIILPGHSLSVFLVKEGKEQNQAVGYLEDGTTVVVENAKRAIGTRNNVVITSIMQTSTNRLVFAKIEE
jgi:hypothetical protein